MLANLTTYFDEAREQIGTAELVKSIINVSLFYLEKEEEEDHKPKSSKKDDISANIEDTLVKLVRLVANICTDE